MKNTIVFFFLSVLLVFTSFGASEASSLEEKGGTILVVIDKMGQPIASVELPSIYAYSGTKLVADINVEVIDPLSGKVIFSTTGKNNSVNLPSLESGEYLVVLKILDYTHKELLSF